MKRSERLTVIASFATGGLFSAWILMRKGKAKAVEVVKTESTADKRKRLINDPNLRILNNQMTYLYLQSYEGTAKNLILLKDVLDLAQPQIVALQLSEKDFNKEYQNVVHHPKFYEVMHKVDNLIKTKDEDQLNNMSELDISKGIENLYLISYCAQIGCKILYADEPNDTYQTKFQQKLRLKSITNNGTIQITEEQKSLYENEDFHGLSLTEAQLQRSIFLDGRAEVFVDKVLTELQPKSNIIPDTPYKMIVALVTKTTINEVVECWKNKFENAYGNQINEDNLHIMDQVELQNIK